ncbi:MAG: hypothetical protein KDJ97_08920 [Anaerolineae bacterium]|nr:hypothetical protein [Anaerolineae bacterium]
MRPHNSTVRNSRYSSQQEQFGARLVYVLVTIILAMATLACNSLFGASSSPVVIRSQLPTLTRTPLPTLTPTAVAIGALPVDQSIEASTAIHERIESVENSFPQVSDNPRGNDKT